MALNTGVITDMDPLSYEYSNYENYSVPEYPYEPKLVQNPYNHDNGNTVNTNRNPVSTNRTTASSNGNTENTNKDTVTTVNIKAVTDEQKPNISDSSQNEPPDIKPDITGMGKKRKAKGKTSTYWSKKITEPGFAFYGCALCNLSYTSLQELDEHVLIHKNRLTSYDLRIKNLKRRKQMLKQKKKLKKLIKSVKKEEFLTTVEIKPEDGYIGSETAAKYEDDKGTIDRILNETNSNNENTQNNGNLTESNTDNGASIIVDAKSNGSMAPSEVDKEMYNMEKIYKCFACEKQFMLSYYLKLHVRSHTDEKPYTCSICGQSFITASKLGRHNKRTHLAVKHQCRICYKFFSRFELLVIHFDKKHADDKLDGEPYDFNAILPYLKELEEQLREKAEAEKKPKTEDLWGDNWPAVEGVKLSPKQELSPESPLPNMSTIPIPERVDVKEEPCDDDAAADDDDTPNDEPADDGPAPEAAAASGDDDDKDDDGDFRGSDSDSDYFPRNTWLPSPAESPRSPPRRAANSLQCDVCHKQYSSTTYLKVHMRTHTGERPFKCYICNRSFITSSKMMRHVLTHGEYDENDELKEDIKEENGEKEGEGKDGEKKKSRKGRKSKTRLIRESKGGKKGLTRPHTCEYCHKRFLRLDTLQVHKRTHDGSSLTIRCHYCLQEAASLAALKTHEATHEPPKPFLCTICGKTYKRREAMMYHRKHHKPENELTCELCTKRFWSAVKLQRHLAAHRQDKFVVRYECPVCAHMFHTKYHARLHLSSHMREGLILEENRNDILAMVMQNARKIPKNADTASLTTDLPSDERSRICNICGEIFQHFFYLEEHLKTHGSKIAIEDLNKEEDKKYTCQVCSKSFKLHYYLKLHMFTHTKEKPFICQQCGKGFITKGKLKRHLETHTGLKKYQCHICYKFFTRPSYLRVHVRTIHGTHDFNFRLQQKRYADVPDAAVPSEVSEHSA